MTSDPRTRTPMADYFTVAPLDGQWEMCAGRRQVRPGYHVSDDLIDLYDDEAEARQECRLMNAALSADLWAWLTNGGTA